ncbi:MAG TPA: hypothetical protein VMB50_04480 [Myxococcales bacterium]|nr:hypothetical protein [Myxococcales bacterium]
MRTALLSLVLLAASPAFASSARAHGWSVELVDGAGRTLPTFEQDGRTYVLGDKGQRYQLRIRNRTPRRIEVVASVDGRDVLDGRPSDFGKRGYLVLPYGDVTIDGFRLNDDSVAAFRFSSVGHSYASLMGDARDVGVIGVAVFPERRPIPRPIVRAEPAEERPWYDFWGYGHGRAGGGGAAGAPSGDANKDLSRDDEAGPAPASPPAASEQAEVEHQASRGYYKKAERPGLGTEFGEERDSRVTEVAFERASSTPAAVLSLRYNDRAGLLALGIDVDGCGTLNGELGLRETADPFRRNDYAQPPPGWSCGGR